MQQVRGPFPFIFRAAAGWFALALAAGAFSNAASAQTIYKWVDERGVVNYGNADVPKSREVKVVDTSPPIAAQPAGKIAAARPARLSDADMLREELMRAREEVARLRQGGAQVAKANTGRGPEGYAVWRDDCEQRRRSDCSEAAYTGENQASAQSPPPAPVRQSAYAPIPAPKPAGTSTVTTLQ